MHENKSGVAFWKPLHMFSTNHFLALQTNMWWIFPSTAQKERRVKARREEEKRHASFNLYFQLLLLFFQNQPLYLLWTQSQPLNFSMMNGFLTRGHDWWFGWTVWKTLSECYWLRDKTSYLSCNYPIHVCHLIFSSNQRMSTWHDFCCLFNLWIFLFFFFVFFVLRFEYY